MIIIQKLSNKGQTSVELILLMGAMLIIIIIISSYIINILNQITNHLEQVIENTRNKTLDNL